MVYTYRLFPGAKRKVVQLRLLTWGDSHRLSLSARGLLGFIVVLHIYAERYVEHFTVTLCSKKLVTAHNVLLRIREDLGLSLLHALPAELATYNNKEKGDYSCKNLEMGTVHWSSHC